MWVTEIGQQDSNLSHTYESKVDSSRSTTDHFLFSESLFDKLLAYCAIDSGVNMSDHVALFTELEIDAEHSSSTDNIASDGTLGMNWETASENDLLLYRTMLDYKLMSLNMPLDALECRHPFCDSSAHSQALLSIFNEIVACCVTSSAHLRKKKRRRALAAGWSDDIKRVKESALLWHKIWKENGSPPSGMLFDIRKSTRRQYHTALRRIKADAEHHQALRMAESLASSSQRDLWTEVKKVRASQKNVRVNVVDNEKGEDICSLFGRKYATLYNSVLHDASEMERLRADTAALIRSQCMHRNCYARHEIRGEDVNKAVKKLKSGKNDALRQIYTNHLKKATPTLHDILASVFTALILHEVIPSDFELSTLIPIPKASNKSLSNSENYRAIAMSSILGKLLDELSGAGDERLTVWLQKETLNRAMRVRASGGRSALHLQRINCLLPFIRCN